MFSPDIVIHLSDYKMSSQTLQHIGIVNVIYIDIDQYEFHLVVIPENEISKLLYES
jgi:hypothetical protein